MMGVFLIFMALVAAMAFAVAERNIIRVRLSRQNIDATSAESLAESGLSIAIASFQADHKFGKNGETLRHEIPVSRDPKAYLTVEFAPEGSSQVPAGKSYNNHQGDAVVVCGEHRCPKNGLFISSVGHCNGVTRSVSAVIVAAPFDYALAATGPVRSRRGMVLGSVPKGYDLSKPLETDKLEAASLLTISKDDAEGAAINLDGPCTLVGDLKAVGTIKLPPNTKPSKGKEMPNSDPEDIPDIPLANYDFAPDLKPLVIADSQQKTTQSYSGLVSWKPKGTEALEFQNGLELNGATLRFKGDVTIKGGIKGQGAIICDGKLTITGTNELRADNQVALLAGGDINIIGQGQSQSNIQGLVYSRGEHGVNIDNATVLGAVIAAGKDAGGGGAKIVVEEGRIAQTGLNGTVNYDKGWTGEDPNKGITDIIAPTFGSPGRTTTLKLLPLVGSDGKLIFNPKPKDFLEHKPPITTLDASLFSFDDGMGGKYFPANTPVEIQKALPDFKPDPSADNKTITNAWDKSQKAKQSMWTTLNKAIAKNGESPVENPVFSLDLNQFLKTNERLKIVWKH